MNEFETVGTSAASVEELEQIEGGVAPLLFGLVGIGATVGGFLVAKSLMGGGGEVIPGLGVFLLGTTAIATAAGGRPS